MNDEEDIIHDNRSSLTGSLGRSKKIATKVQGLQQSGRDIARPRLKPMVTNRTGDGFRTRPGWPIYVRVCMAISCQREREREREREGGGGGGLTLSRKLFDLPKFFYHFWHLVAHDVHIWGDIFVLEAFKFQIMSSGPRSHSPHSPALFFHDERYEKSSYHMSRDGLCTLGCLL